MDASPGNAKTTRTLPEAESLFAESSPPDTESEPGEPPAKRRRVDGAGGGEEVTIGGPGLDPLGDFGSHNDTVTERFARSVHCS